MIYRDRRWRAAGGLLLAAGLVVGALAPAGISVMPGFVLAISGLVLLVQGKRVPLAFRIERSAHRELPGTIHARRRARSLK